MSSKYLSFILIALTLFILLGVLFKIVNLESNTSLSSNEVTVTDTVTDFPYSFPITIGDFSYTAYSHLCDESQCSGPGAINIRYGEKTQILYSDNLLFTREEITPEFSTSLEQMHLQRPVAIGDYNFDTFNDICVNSGTQGGYGSASCDVYLFNATSSTFVFNSDLTELSNNSMGYLEINTKDRLLYSFKKSGCCEHTDSRYGVIRDTPILMYEISTSTATSGDIMVTEKKRLSPTDDFEIKQWQLTANPQ